ncbi:hypothetical protein ACH79_25135 [Bradyrhizobium sp. CCBAU 051011]|nr:hypothetical protein ACH79_25135 [Bradyrhizobium sp. CCBAU 051011]
MIDHPGSEAGGIGKRDAGLRDQRIQVVLQSAWPMLACKRFDVLKSRPDTAAGSTSYSLLGCDAKAVPLTFY